MKKLIYILLLVFCANGCGVVIPYLIPFNDLPQPTGPFNVGTQIFEWEDKSREEWFTEESGDFRRMVSQARYPTLDEPTGELAYLDYPEKRIGPLSKRIEIPKFLIRHIQDVESNSILNATIKVDDALYPLILFSHGLGGMRMQNTVQMEELASSGYIVLSMDHPYDANITIFEDGSIAEFRSGIRDGATEKEFWEVRLPQINTRAADLSFILDQIIEKKGNGTQLWDFIDLTKVGVFGHSFGGATSVVTSYKDSRIDACINLDGWMEPIESKIIQQGLNIPFLYIGQEKWKDTPLNDIKLDSLIESSHGRKELFPGTKHFDYSDTPQFSSVSSKLGIAGKMDMHELRDRINSEILSFFDLYVKKAK